MHPLERVINSPEPLVLIGNASEDRFPGYSYDVYTRIGKKFYCLDMGGLPVSRGPTKGGKVYHTVAELPDDRGDLAVIWVHPKTASGAVDLAHEAGVQGPHPHGEGVGALPTAAADRPRRQAPRAALSSGSRVADSSILCAPTLVFTATKQFGNNRGVHPFASAVLVGLLEVRRSHEEGRSHY
ncbi:MAG: hypothetical protein JRJ64_15105 [Deltaproteobacteria bacterium]|nr:hypothetical protein [Deltaproteobacteria bacterium]